MSATLPYVTSYFLNCFVIKPGEKSSLFVGMVRDCVAKDMFSVVAWWAML